MSIRVGIDLGTTYSAVARINPNTGKPEVIKNKYGKSTTPSVLYFDPSGDLMYGQDAKDMQSLGDGNAVSFFKRNMGNDYFAVEMNGREYTAEDFSAEFLKCIVKEAEAKCGEKIKDAVITVPAYFTHKERESTMRAGEKAGLNVLAIINEPTAAAFAYGLNEVPGEQTVLIYDLGGGTFDVTIARINQDSIQVLGSDGNHELGGKDWDELLCGYLVREYMTRTDLDPTDDFDFMDSMSVLAENTKKKLTDMDSVSVPVNFRGRRENIDVSEELFTEITSYLLEETMDKTNSLLGELGLGWSDLTGTILVGGSTRMKMVHRFIKDKTGREPMGGVNVDEAVALGAAIRANIDENGKEIKSVIAGFLGGGAQAMPVLGAKSIVDATAHALGMIAESVDGERYENSVIIPKNKAIPAEEKKSYSFRTRSKDNEMEVYVLQGSHQRPLDNTILYKYVITDIMPVPGNMTMIEVAYRYTSNGVVEVEAVQKETNKKLPIRIEPVPEDMSWTDGSPKDNVSATYSAPDVEVILAIDLSGSMSGSPLTLAQKAMTDFVDQMDSEMVKIGVMEFSDKVKVSQKPTNNYHSVKSAIKRFTIGSALGYGNAGQPFTETLKILGKNTDAIRYLIVMTDGVWSNSNKAISEAKRCHLEEIQVMALGFGGADKQFLKAIASTDEFADLTKIENLSGSFSKIARAIGDNSTGVRG